MVRHPWFGSTPFRTASAFSTALFLDRFLRGQGGQWLERVRRFIDRKQAQGVVGGRVFLQTCDWRRGDHPFFSDRGSSKKADNAFGFESRMWDYGALARGERPTKLTAHTQSYLLKLVEIARETDFKWELSLDATLKHTPGVGWNVIGHTIRQTAAFLRGVHRAEWDPSTMDERFRGRFDAAAGPIDELIAVELHNEWDAHSRGAWEEDGLDRAGALREVNRQLERMGREEQWPEGAVFVSHGGRDTIEYDPSDASAVAVHPARPSLELGGRLDPLKRFGKPVYANEIVHYIDPSMWGATVGSGVFRPGSSTSDARAWVNFVDELLARGIWVCEHSLVGMANGFWLENGTWSEMLIDEAEKIRGGDSRPVPGPGPAPEPTPAPSRLRYAPVIALAYRDILDREPDEGGLEAYNDAMSRGLTEAEVREALIRSAEYEERNPE